MTQYRSPSQTESIESQVAAKIVCDLLVNKIIDLEHPFAKKLAKWITPRLPAITESTPTLPDEIKKAIKNLETKIETKPT